MSQSKPVENASPGADPAAAAHAHVDLTLHEFWERNRSVVLGACVVALLLLIGREAVQYFSAQREKSVQAEFAQVADSPAKLSAFAEGHAGHPLAGVAWLKLADDKFTAGDFSGAATAYQKATDNLHNDALRSRARLGAAVSQVNGSDKAAGTAALKAIYADAALPKTARAEAGYHLATLALDAGNFDEVRKLVDEIGRLEPTSTWSQRATVLLASLPASAQPANNPAGLTFKPGK
ncbi:MAG TPA: tetratricopeptide repeat protein [Lacunisphaera sp.]|nr:tetratricopeptide repeat protein [Lacunisphaera sp.]